VKKLPHKFVEFIPEVIEDSVLYVSVQYGTALHRCCCGCGREIVTPFTPSDWKMIFDGETISLSPSIGNWNSPCRSHYWIRHNRVEWTEDWTKEQVEAVTAKEQEEKRGLYHKCPPINPSKGSKEKSKPWQGLRGWLNRWR
jgi:hypothetical protein